MIPFILTLTFSILITLVFAIPGIFLSFRWFSMFINEDSESDVGDMKILTFYALDSGEDRDEVARIICMSIVGVVFGGIHCVGWFFDFPSSAEVLLWRVSSTVLTGIAFLLPVSFTFVAFLSGSNSISDRQQDFAAAVFLIMLLVYVVSRLLLLVEAFISLRHLIPGMLALVKWTSFIPHI